MPTYTSFNSLEEMFDEIEKQRKLADSRVTPEQKAYRPGQIVISDSGMGFPIFHEILDVEKIARDEIFKYSDEESAIHTLDIYRQPHMKNFCPAKSYSIFCQDGELGDIHRSQIIGKIPKYIFTFIKSRRFDLSFLDKINLHEI